MVRRNDPFHTPSLRAYILDEIQSFTSKKRSDHSNSSVIGKISGNKSRKSKKKCSQTKTKKDISFDKFRFPPGGARRVKSTISQSLSLSNSSNATKHSCFLLSSKSSVQSRRTDSIRTCSVHIVRSSRHSDIVKRKLLNIDDSRGSLSNHKNNLIVDIYNRHSYQQYSQVKADVQKAINEHKTFLCCRPTQIKRCLRRRGWIEKIQINDSTSFNRRMASKMTVQQLTSRLNDPKHGYMYKQVLQSKLLGSHQCDFIWDPTPSMQQSVRNKPIYINTIMKNQQNYCSKIGLCFHMRNLQWHYWTNAVDLYHPRTYIIPNNEMADFVADFRITACTSLLKWAVAQQCAKRTIFSAKGTVPIDVFHFATLQCAGYIRNKIEGEFRLFNSEQTWHKFILFCNECIHKKQHFQLSQQYTDGNDMIRFAKTILQRMNVYISELQFQGIYNVWILKPSLATRGQGIHITDSLSQIKIILNVNPNVNYVIQKYIERPLLVYNTKFDIRQWFLISSTNPLTVWMYKESYLRFSSQTYDLCKFHESIHLTNHAVQHRYRNSAIRSRLLPLNNMWHSNTFQKYLTSIGKPHVWSNKIYPKMKQAIAAVILSATDSLVRRSHSFEIYGADFIITPDFQPWLLEINTSPDLSHSTKVTAELCPRLMEDVARVVIDKGKEPHNFDLVYKELCSPEHTCKETLKLVGKHLKPSEFKLIDKLITAQLKLQHARNKRKHINDKINERSCYSLSEKRTSSNTTEQFSLTNSIECLCSTSITSSMKIHSEDMLSLPVTPLSSIERSSSRKSDTLIRIETLTEDEDESGKDIRFESIPTNESNKNITNDLVKSQIKDQNTYKEIELQESKAETKFIESENDDLVETKKIKKEDDNTKKIIELIKANEILQQLKTMKQTNKNKETIMNLNKYIAECHELAENISVIETLLKALHIALEEETNKFGLKSAKCQELKSAISNTEVIVSALINDGVALQKKAYKLFHDLRVQ